MYYDIFVDFKGYYYDEDKIFWEWLYVSIYLVIEDVGVGKDKIFIDFMLLGDFGFDESWLYFEE